MFVVFPWLVSCCVGNSLPSHPLSFLLYLLLGSEAFPGQFRDPYHLLRIAMGFLQELERFPLESRDLLTPWTDHEI